MRHDPAAGAIVIMLRSLKMYGMAQAVTDLIEQGAPAFEAAIPILSQLLNACSTRWRASIPRDRGQPFHAKVGSRSTG